MTKLLGAVQNKYCISAVALMSCFTLVAGDLWSTAPRLKYGCVPRHVSSTRTKQTPQSLYHPCRSPPFPRSQPKISTTSPWPRLVLERIQESQGGEGVDRRHRRDNWPDFCLRKSKLIGTNAIYLCALGLATIAACS